MLVCMDEWIGVDFSLFLHPPWLKRYFLPTLPPGEPQGKGCMCKGHATTQSRIRRTKMCWDSSGTQAQWLGCKNVFLPVLGQGGLATKAFSPQFRGFFWNPGVNAQSHVVNGMCRFSLEKRVFSSNVVNFWARREWWGTDLPPRLERPSQAHPKIQNHWPNLCGKLVGDWSRPVAMQFTTLVQKFTPWCKSVQNWSRPVKTNLLHGVNCRNHGVNCRNHGVKPVATSRDQSWPVVTGTWFFIDPPDFRSILS